MSFTAQTQLTERQKSILTSFVLLTITVIASIPLLSRTLLWGADLEFHLIRIEGISRGLQDGQFPVMMQTVQVGGYGYPVSIMYGDALLYFPAILHLLGVSTAMAYRIFALLMNVATVYGSYAIFRRLFSSREVGLLTSALWTLSTYRLDDMYSRGAVGESIAMLFFPLLAFGIASVLFPQRKGSTRHGGTVCALAAAGILTSHVITSELVIIALLPILGWAIWHHHKSVYFWKQLGVACFLSVILSLFFLLPLFDYSRQGNLQVFNQSLQSQIDLVSRKAIEPAQLLTLFLPLTQVPEGDAFQGDIPYSIGWALIAAASVYWLTTLLDDRNNNPKRSSQLRSIGAPLSISIVLCLLLTTTLFPWHSQRFAACFRFIYNIQFPTRILAPACMLISILGALGLSRLQTSITLGRYTTPVFTTLLVLCCIEGGVTTSTFTFNAKAESPVSTSLATSSGVAGGEYLIQGTNLAEIFPTGYIDGKPRVSKGINYNHYHKDGTTIDIDIHAKNEGTITLPLFAYNNYQISTSRQSSGLQLSSSHDGENLLTIRVTKAFSGKVRVWYRPPITWRIAEVVSLTGWIGCILFYVLDDTRISRKIHRRHRRTEIQ